MGVVANSVFVFGTGASGELRTIATIPVNGDSNVSISQNNKEGSSNTADYLPSPTMQSIGESALAASPGPLIAEAALQTSPCRLKEEGTEFHL